MGRSLNGNAAADEMVQGMVWKCAKCSHFSCDNSFDEYLNETVNGGKFFVPPCYSMHDHL